MTGHQGEPRATLSKLIFREIKYTLRKGDHVIFASKTIPTADNLKAKEVICNKLRSQGVRIFENIHVSGHAGKEDLRELIQLVKPQYIIPSHGEMRMEQGMMLLAAELGYDKKKVMMVRNGQRFSLV
jgi:ribonuclease J